jgi:cytosine deaminase
MPRVNASGTLLEGIALWGENSSRSLTVDAIIERALTYCDWAVAQRAAGRSARM